jgi:hypothetical protein
MVMYRVIMLIEYMLCCIVAAGLYLIGIHKWDLGPVVQRMSTAIQLLAADKAYSSSEGLVGFTKQDEDYR